mmetsp:Transcript_958/g.3662  ORF Transcript_958/g.3662 Transcript_958/m.3662 type:complete len:321 (-) Transcript_958:905-1867(-)
MSTACLASLRGGSIIPTKPRNVISVSSSRVTSVDALGMGFIASASTRSDERAKTETFAWSASITSSVNVSDAPARSVNTEAHRFRTCSGAPFVNKMLWPFLFARTLIIFRSRENSKHATLLNCCSQYCAQYAARSLFAIFDKLCGSASAPGRPIFSASARSAASVDSPILSNLLVFSSHTRHESLHRLAQIETCSTLGDSAGRWTTEFWFLKMSPLGEYPLPFTTYSSSGIAPPAVPSPPKPEVVRTTTNFVTVIAFVVRVPVLSLQITEVHPRVSTEDNVRTIALRFAIFRVPNARQVVTTAGNPSGIAATARATAILK